MCDVVRTWCLVFGGRVSVSVTHCGGVRCCWEVCQSGYDNPGHDNCDIWVYVLDHMSLPDLQGCFELLVAVARSDEMEHVTVARNNGT